VKHWIIATNLGHDGSVEALKRCYAHGLVSKELFATALRARQAAVGATKSPQRTKRGSRSDRSSGCSSKGQLDNHTFASTRCSKEVNETANACRYPYSHILHTHTTETEIEL
jgi:hypothetical protein